MYIFFKVRLECLSEQIADYNILILYYKITCTIVYHAYSIYNFLLCLLLRSFRAVEGSILSFIYNVFSLCACLPTLHRRQRTTSYLEWDSVSCRA